MARQKTGVTVNCPCGATDVPMAWGTETGEVKLYRHVRGLLYRVRTERGLQKCSGPEDLFAFMLREAGLATVSEGGRTESDADQDHDNGMLF
jgi:hypothetical protein